MKNAFGYWKAETNKKIMHFLLYKFSDNWAFIPTSLPYPKKIIMAIPLLKVRILGSSPDQFLDWVFPLEVGSVETIKFYLNN